MKDNSNDLSVVSRGSRYRFGIACAMITVIPSLILYYLLFGNVGAEFFSNWKNMLLLGFIAVMVSLGWIILYRYPFTIIRLRAYLENIIKGELPESIALLHTEEDIVAIEKGVNMILDRLTEKVESMEDQILEVSEREQRHIGHNLHDGLGQHLSGIALKAMVLEKRLADKGISESEEVKELRELVSEALDQAKQMSKGLCPVQMGEGGLQAALGDLASGAQRMFGIKCTVDLDSNMIVEDEVASHLYRIAQEAVTNAVKHGKADIVEIGFKKEDDSVTLRIWDNGSGIDKADQPENGMGMGIMQYRAGKIGAAFDVASGSDGGTLVICVIEKKKETKG